MAVVWSLRPSSRAILGKLRCSSLRKHIHSDLAGHDNVFVALRPQNIFHRHLEVLGRAFNNLFGAYVFWTGLGAPSRLVAIGRSGVSATHLTERQQLIKGTFKLTDIGLHQVCQIFDNGGSERQCRGPGP